MQLEPLEYIQMAKHVKLMCIALIILFVGLVAAYEEEWAKHIVSYIWSFCLIDLILIQFLFGEKKQIEI